MKNYFLQNPLEILVTNLNSNPQLLNYSNCTVIWEGVGTQEGCKWAMGRVSLPKGKYEQ